MPLVSAKVLLAHAQQARYAVPLFDFFEMTGCEDYFDAVNEKRAPAITGMYAGTFDQGSSKAFVAALRTFGEAGEVPVALMLDHGRSVEQCLAALDRGFTDVMYDGSSLSLDENIAKTRTVAHAAHAAGAAVEAELGHVGSGDEYQQFGAKRKGFTDASTVERFVGETGVDMLAIAIGTAHGLYKGEPELDMELLAEIRRRVTIPLVLHGGTGLSEQQFRAAIAGGISKINVATDLVQTMSARMRAAAQAKDADFFKMMRAAHEGMRERCGYYLDLFGSSGKAAAVLGRAGAVR